jgi:hypothetical protein
LVPVTLAVLLFGLLVWPGLAFNFGNKFRLSTVQSYKAFSPDIATAGAYVAAVWSEGYNGDSLTKQYGRVYLKSADTTNGWQERIQVFTATSSVWGRDPRLVFDPSVPAKVHVVWAQANGCPSCSWSSIQYTTCTLSGADTCAAPTEIVGGLTDASTPDLAVDSGGGVHVAWREQGGSPDVGPIRYCKKGACGSPSTVDNGQHPALAFANGYVHLVWDTGSQTASTIRYSRDSNFGNGTWDGTVPWKIWWNSPPPTIPYWDPSYPAVGASGSAVYVAWAVRNNSDASEYALAFDFSQDTGQNWLAGTSGFGRNIPENVTAVFSSTWFAADVTIDELYGLQPDVVVTGTGATAYAHVVWQGKVVPQGAYEAWYSYLPGVGAPAWTVPDRVDSTGHEDDIGLPAIAVGAGLNDTHVAFVEDADATSFSNIEVWYVGAIGNRDQDSDVNEGTLYLPRVSKNR